MLCTLKPHFLGGFSKDLREMYINTSSKDLPKRAKKTPLRLDGVQYPLGSPFVVQQVQLLVFALPKLFLFAKNSIQRKTLLLSNLKLSAYFNKRFLKFVHILSCVTRYL